MALPDELVKPIDEIKTPSNRVLVICLISTIVFIVPWGIVQIKKRDTEIQRLNERAAAKAEEDNQRLTKRNEFMDSLLYLQNKRQ